MLAAATLESAAPSSGVKQDLSHGAAECTIQVPAVLEVDIRLAEDFEVRLAHEALGIESMGRNKSLLMFGDLPERLVDGVDQLILGPGFALADSVQDLGHKVTI